MFLFGFEGDRVSFFLKGIQKRDKFGFGVASSSFFGAMSVLLSMSYLLFGGAESRMIGDLHGLHGKHFD